MKKLTEHQAWLHLEKLWRKREGVAGVALCAGTGLCWCIRMLWTSERLISDIVYDKMLHRIEDDIPPDADSNCCPYYWPRNEAGAIARAEFCRKMAAKCKPRKKVKA